MIIIILNKLLGGIWKIDAPSILNVGTNLTPVIKMIPNSNSVMCATSNMIKIINIDQLKIDFELEIRSDTHSDIIEFVIYELGLWITFANSPIIKCYNAHNYSYLCQINAAAAVTQILQSSQQ